MNKKIPTGPLYHPVKKNSKHPKGSLYHPVGKKNQGGHLVLFIKKVGKKELFKDDKSKECSKCHKIKTHNEFNTTNGRLMYICKECKKIQDAVYMNKKKLRVINEIYGGEFKNSCVKCKIGIVQLPVLQFHHINPGKKTTIWHEIHHKNYKDIIRILEREKVRILCSNCHLEIGATLFSEFKGLILRRTLFDNSPERLDEIINDKLVIHKRTKNRNPNYRAKIKRQIIFWIKKRYIIEQLYDGNCIACGKISVQDNLPALQFHHTSRSKKKTEKWEDYSNLRINEIANILQKEACVCVCGNCHTLIHSTSFEKYINQIHNKINNNVRKHYSKIKMNVKFYKFKNLQLKDPFYKEFGFGEAWKKYLLQIREHYGISNPREFSSKELSKSLNISDRYLRRVLKGLIEDGLIKIIKKSVLTSSGRTPIKYKLSKKGVNTIQEF